jgi:hypothetical protein
MISFELAWQNVALAGRELGSGPAAAVNRIVPNLDEIGAWLSAHNITDERAGGIMLGIAVGMVMAEEPNAIETLTKIQKEWIDGHHR